MRVMRLLFIFLLMFSCASLVHADRLDSHSVFYWKKSTNVALTGSEDRTAVLRDVQSGKTIQIWKHTDTVTSVAFSPDGQQVLTGSEDRTAVLRDVQSGKTLQTLRIFGRPFTSVAFSPDGKQVLTSSKAGQDGGDAILRDVNLASNYFEIFSHDRSVVSIAFSPDGKQVMTGSEDRTAVLRKIGVRAPLQIWKHKDTVTSVAFSPDGKQVLTGSEDRTVVLRDVKSGETIRTWKYDKAVKSVAFQPVAVTDLMSALSQEISKVESAHQHLPQTIADRQSKLEREKPTKDEFEPVGQFNQRVAEWNKAVERLNEDIKAHHAAVGSIPLGKRAHAFERALARAYGDPELHDLRYDPETARFFATLKASRDPKFKRLVSIAVPNDQARAAKDKLISVENGLEIELRVTDKNELIWGQPRVRLDNEIILADYVDRDFIPPVTTNSPPPLAADRTPNLATVRKQSEHLGAKPRIDLQVSATSPAGDGAYTISIQTNIDTASLKINGEELGGKSDGSYSINRVARAGQDTKLDIIAKDVYGNSDRKTITVSRAIVDSKAIYTALNPAHVKRQPDRDAVAIIIGIANYKSLPKAEFANDDARVFYDYAIRALGVKPENIKLLVDQDAEDVEIIKAFKTWLPSRVKSTTDVYVFYSGHGLPTQDGQGLYLLPPRADRDFISRTAIQFQEINADLQAAKPKSVTIFMDACYSGQARSGETLVANARPVSLKAEKKLFPDHFTVITASQADQISSSSPDLKHGIFSYYLMKGMEGDADANKDGKITLGEMQTYLVENVGRQAGMMSRKQEPQLIGDISRVLVGR
jgi:hypothetical protein